MTYSRPTTTTVNALDLPQPYQPLSSPGRQEVSVTGNGRLFDNTNPAQAGASAGRNTEAIGNFLGNIIKPGAAIYKGVLQEQASDQVGKFMQTVDVENLYRSADSAGRDMLHSLNPFAQDAVNKAVAGSAAKSYLETYAILRAKDKRFENPGIGEEERNRAEVDIRAMAIEKSGIGSVPPAFMAEYLPGIAEGTATIKADGYRKVFANRRIEMNGSYQKGLEDQLPTFSTRLDAAGNTYGPGGDTKGFLTEFGGYFQGEHDKQVKGGYRTSVEFAAITANAITATIEKMKGREDYEGALNLIRGLKMGLASEVKTSLGLSLWDVPIGEAGASIRTRLGAIWAELRPEYEKWQQREAVRRFGPDLALATQQGPEGEAARLRISNRLPELGNNPEALSQVQSMLGQSQATSRTATDAQLREEGRLALRFNDPSRDRGKFNAEILSANLTEAQRTNFLWKNTQPDDPTLVLVGNAGKYAKGELQQVVTDVYNAAVASGKIPRNQTPEQAKSWVRQTMLDIEIGASKNSEKTIKALQAQGRDVGSSDALAIYRDNLTKIRDQKLGGYKVSPSASQSPSQRLLNNATLVQEGMNANRGVPTIGIFPPEVIKASKAAGIPQDYRNVSKFFVTQMRAAKGADGKALFPDADKAYQKMVNDARKAGGRTPQAAQPQGAPSPMGNVPIVQFGQGVLRLLHGLDLNNPQPAPKPTGKSSDRNAKGTMYSPPAKKQDQASGGLGQQVIAKGLEILGNVIAPPTSAAEGPSAASKPAMVNPEGLPALAALWGGSTPMGPTTPRLPQLAANAPAQGIPLAITSDRHPIMLAIGIAEGTRTASGGYTQAYYGHRDPADGNWNVGTVSGGGVRGGEGSPQAVDRRRMADMTQRSMRVAPVLQRLGIPINSVAYNRLMFNALDLSVQAPGAFPDFVRRIPSIIANGMTIEAIAKARADSYINPATGRLEAGGFGNNYSRLLADQRSRAGAYDYKKRL